jgi:hypothetical protein
VPAPANAAAVVSQIADRVYAHRAPPLPDCVAGVRGLELRNVGANYPFESSHGFPRSAPNFGHGDYSRLSCSAGDNAARGWVLPGVDAALGEANGSRSGRTRPQLASRLLAYLYWVGWPGA